MPNSTTDRRLPQLDVETAVRDRYSAASQSAEPSLCCAVEYDTKYLAVLPPEILERDYGCGDPSRYVTEGETVLDLGSGGGKICYIASQIVGPRGRVLGVDMNDDMLALARKYRGQVAARIGWDNVEFRKARIQDLALDLEQFQEHLASQPVTNVRDWFATQRLADEFRQRTPLVADQSIDVVLSNCVLNLVSPQDRGELFGELFRVLRPGGRAVISDIVSDRPVPPHLQDNAELWSGCISGAFVEEQFVAKFEQAGFYGVAIVARQTSPWTTVEGIEFRSMTIQAFKPATGPSQDLGHKVVYRGPWQQVTDDHGFTLRRGVPLSVTDQQYSRLSRRPYDGEVIAIPSGSNSVDSGSLPLISAARSVTSLQAHPDKQSDSANGCCGPNKCC